MTALVPSYRMAVEPAAAGSHAVGPLFLTRTLELMVGQPRAAEVELGYMPVAVLQISPDLSRERLLGILRLLVTALETGEGGVPAVSITLPPDLIGGFRAAATSSEPALHARTLLPPLGQLIGAAAGEAEMIVRARLAGNLAADATSGDDYLHAVARGIAGGFRAR